MTIDDLLENFLEYCNDNGVDFETAQKMLDMLYKEDSYDQD